MKFPKFPIRPPECPPPGASYVEFENYTIEMRLWCSVCESIMGITYCLGGLAMLAIIGLTWGAIIGFMQ